MGHSIDRRAFLAVAVTGVAAGSLALPGLAHADEITDLKAQAEEVQAQLDEANKELAVKIDEYDTHMHEYEVACAARDSAQGVVDTKEKKIKANQELLASRMKTMYTSDQASFFDVLMGSTSFESFATTLDFLNNLNEEDADLIVETKVARREAEDARDEAERQAGIASEAMAKAEAEKAEIEARVADYEAKYKEINEQILKIMSENEAAREAAWAIAYANFGVEEPICEAAIECACAQLGKPYVWGAKGPDTFDCSGLTQYCYRFAGISIAGSTTTQYAQASAAGNVLPVTSVRPGDVVYVGYSGDGSSGHVGIYIGGGQFIHAPQTGDVVKVSSNMGMWTHALRFA